MDLVPDEILLMIFNFMSPYEVSSVVARVCSRWALVSRRRAINVRHKQYLNRLRYCPRALLVSACLPYNDFFNSLNLLSHSLRELSVHSDMPFSDDELLRLTTLSNLSHLDVFTYTGSLGSSLLPIAERLSSLVVNHSMPRGFLRSRLEKLRAFHMYGHSLNYPPCELNFFLRANVNQLCELTLRCNVLRDVTYEVMSLCSNLKVLQLYSCWLMTRVGVMHLVRLQKLCCLHITGSHMVRGMALLAFLCELPKSIGELVLSSSCFGDEHIHALSKRLPKLRTFELWYCRASTYGLKTLVMSLQALEEFDTNNSFGESDLQILAEHPSLKRVTCRFKLPFKDKSMKKNVKFSSAHARYKDAVLRGDGNGYRADLFYYWMQRVPLETIKVSSHDQLDT